MVGPYVLNLCIIILVGVWVYTPKTNSNGLAYMADDQ